MNLRNWIGQRLFNLSDWLDELAIDVSGMRDGLNDVVQKTPEEAELSAARRNRFITNLTDRHLYPCPECEGNQLVKRGPGFITCPECAGTGVDQLVRRQ